MASNKMTQSEIDALLKQSDLQDSAYKSSQIEQSRFKQQEENEQPNYKPKSRVTQTQNEYGQDEFEDYEQSRKTMNINNNLGNKNKPSKEAKSSVYDSYAQEDFESYEQSRRTKQFERSQPNMRFNNKKPQSQQLKAINQQQTKNKTQTNKKVSFQQTSTSNQAAFNKNKPTTIIKTANQTKSIAPSPKSTAPFIKNQQTKQYKNLPYNYNRLQQRQKDLLFTSLTEDNKKLKQLLADRDKQLNAVKTKYNILLQEKAQVLGNAKQATLRKQLELLQTKYDTVLKQKAKQRAYKTVSAQMSKTMTNNFVLQQQADERQQQLLVIVEKLKQRLISTDKQLKTLQQKMNEGLDYQEELQRKLKRVQQLELRMQKMKIQAQEDRDLIEMLKEKTKQQKQKIQELQEEKNQLNLCLKRAQMTQATQSDFKHQIEELKRQKQLLQNSLKQISMNFTTNLLNNPNNKRPKKPQLNDIIEDSNELLSYKK